MDDLISRQTAIDTMMRLQAEDIEMYGCAIPEGFDGDRAAEALKALPSAQPERRDYGWTGIEDDYPVSIRDVIDITAETGALYTQSRVMELKPYRLPESKTGRWIPCSERLPEIPCLIMDAHHNTPYVSSGILRVNDDRHQCTWAIDNKYVDWPKMSGNRVDLFVWENRIIAWMPLPEPYKED